VREIGRDGGGVERERERYGGRERGNRRDGAHASAPRTQFPLIEYVAGDSGEEGGHVVANGRYVSVSLISPVDISILTTFHPRCCTYVPHTLRDPHLSVVTGSNHRVFKHLSHTVVRASHQLLSHRAVEGCQPEAEFRCDASLDLYIHCHRRRVGK
jgi:hypothetical protein